MFRMADCNSGCMKYALHFYTAGVGGRCTSMPFKVHWVQRTMMASLNLIICVGCLNILQSNSLGNNTFMYVFAFFSGIPFLKYCIILFKSYVNCCAYLKLINM